MMKTAVSPFPASDANAAGIISADDVAESRAAGGETSGWLITALLLVSFLTSAILASLLSMVEVHDTPLSWVICSG
jgi:hypothetical protein